MPKRESSQSSSKPESKIESKSVKADHDELGRGSRRGSHGGLDDDQDLLDEVQAAPKEAPAAADLGRYPGDTIKDRKTGKKGRFINEYGTNGRAIIVMPDGSSRSELWDATQAEIIKRVKRPTTGIVIPQPMAASSDDDDYVEEDLDES